MRFYELPMDGREPVKLTLNMGALADLSASDHELWQRYNTLYTKMQNMGPKDSFNELEMGELMYIAYRCGMLHSNEQPMTKSDFLYAMTDDRAAIGQVFQALYGVQEKKSDFQRPSGKPRRK
jgi:hypothetical protein